MQPDTLKMRKLRRWFVGRSGITKGLLLGFFIPLFLSVAVGLIGAALGTATEDAPGARVISFALFSFDYPGLLFLSTVSTGMLPPGDESFAMFFLAMATLPACVFWALIGCTIGWMIRMTNI
jgi:hypothetical protein